VGQGRPALPLGLAALTVEADRETLIILSAVQCPYQGAVTEERASYPVLRIHGLRILS